jgi:hypothetical protein
MKRSIGGSHRPAGARRGPVFYKQSREKEPRGGRRNRGKQIEMLWCMVNLRMSGSSSLFAQPIIETDVNVIGAPHEFLTGVII